MKVEGTYELFEWLLESYGGLTREQVLERLSKMPGIAGLQDMSKEDLLGEYCERLVASFEASGFGKKRSA
jgi:hypothetical protein